MSNKTADKQLFMQLCYNDIKLSDINDIQKRKLLEGKFLISSKCRKCGEEVEREEAFIGQTYWNGTWVISHKQCNDWVKTEAYECQNIDAACNDCKYFIREAGVHGICAKKSIAVKGYQNYYEGNKCFVHRKITLQLNPTH